ncbi:hypothetical protein [Streptomyces sp. NPDC059593]|uniref:hypothetical protein n=1 Tax=Streptomyces sp. NPDC059593 TaxID=3346878 RepID=UPI0036A7D886
MGGAPIAGNGRRLLEAPMARRPGSATHASDATGAIDAIDASRVARTSCADPR